MSDALPPEVQAVIDAARYVQTDAAKSAGLVAALRAYDASRAPKERYTVFESPHKHHSHFPWAVIDETDFPADAGTAVAYHLAAQTARQHAAWLNAADRGDLFTREQVEARERAADRKAREECARIAKEMLGPHSMTLEAIRASIKDKP